MIDTHTHIYLENDFPDGETAGAVERAIKAGVGQMVFPGVDRESLPQIFELYERYPAHTAIALGLHPTEVTDSWECELEEILSHASHPGVVAIGEIGLDLHECDDNYNQQIAAFRAQTEYAFSRHLPIIVHQRDALHDTLRVLGDAAEVGRLPETMVFHCFTGSSEDVKRIRCVVPDAYFGIGGVATFKNARTLREALPEIGIDHIVLETDAPWLAPVPFRGKRNESAFIPYIAAVVASTLDIPVETVAEITDRNALHLFPLLKSER